MSHIIHVSPPPPPVTSVPCHELEDEDRRQLWCINAVLIQHCHTSLSLVWLHWLAHVDADANEVCKSRRTRRTTDTEHDVDPILTMMQVQEDQDHHCRGWAGRLVGRGDHGGADHDAVILIATQTLILTITMVMLTILAVGGCGPRARGHDHGNGRRSGRGRG